MSDLKRTRAINSINKAIRADPKLLKSVDKAAKLSQDLVGKNHQLRLRLGRAIDALRTISASKVQQDLIEELEQIKNEYLNLDRYFISATKKTMTSLFDFNHSILKQIGKDSVPNNALNKRHEPNRKARQLLWKEWDTNGHKYTVNNKPCKAECARRNYDQIMAETKAGSKVKRATFERWLTEKRPSM
jgi:hypothetical protein|uniref:hypothetical protein n=1 Tax=Orrella sp. TaxID=1921583 RepID=UPI0040480151